MVQATTPNLIDDVPNQINKLKCSTQSYSKVIS